MKFKIHPLTFTYSYSEAMKNDMEGKFVALKNDIEGKFVALKNDIEGKFVGLEGIVLDSR